MPEPKLVETPPPDAEEASEGGSSQGPPAILRLGVLAGAVIVGLGLGAFVLGPRLTPPGSGAAAEAQGGAPEKPKPKHKPSEGHGSALEIENLVVNPSGAEGQHYVLTTIVLEVHDEDYDKYLRSNEYVVRDVVMGTLRRCSLAELGQPGIRDTLKTRVARDVGALIGGPEFLTVYIPDFVVQ